LGSGEHLTADFLRDVGLTAVGADFCWDGFEDQRRVFPLKGDGGAARAGSARAYR